MLEVEGEIVVLERQNVEQAREWLQGILDASQTPAEKLANDLKVNRARQSLERAMTRLDAAIKNDAGSWSVAKERALFSAVADKVCEIIIPNFRPTAEKVLSQIEEERIGNAEIALQAGCGFFPDDAETVREKADNYWQMGAESLVDMVADAFQKAEGTSWRETWEDTPITVETAAATKAAYNELFSEEEE
jgi:hypothetical protein